MIDRKKILKNAAQGKFHRTSRNQILRDANNANSNAKTGRLYNRKYDPYDASSRLECCAALYCAEHQMCVVGMNPTMGSWGGGPPGSGCHCVDIVYDNTGKIK